MASINEGYSEKVRIVKDMIFNEVLTHQRLPKMDIERFSTRLDDVWKAIQSESFVFCFRNHNEINAYDKLDYLLNDIRWGLNKTANSSLRNLKDKIKENPDTEESMIYEISGRIEEAYDIAKEKLDNFFNAADDGKVLREWSPYYGKKLETMKDDKIGLSKRLLSAEINIQRVKNDRTVR